MTNVTVKTLIEKIEGEAELDFTFNQGKIEDVKINFGFYRGIEEILRGHDAWDALVITPRVCGICNHAHLIAAVSAIENGYENAGLKIDLTSKAKAIREFTLSCELIQNHIKWLYMTILPQLEKHAGAVSEENYAIKATYLASTITKALAVFAGQWPHSSYAIPGGVTCDPTHLDVMQAQTLVDESIKFFEEVVVGLSLDDYLSIESISNLDQIQGDLGKLLHLMLANHMGDKGYSHDRFIVFGDCILSKPGRSVITNVTNVDISRVLESEQEGTVAKAVTYKDKFYEVGPLARGMVAKTPLVRSLHKRFKDSVLSRVFSRIHEVALLLDYSKSLLNNLQLDEVSCVLNADVRVHDFDGVGIVEAARGSLIHKTTVRDGIITKYAIITPTQWNLGNSTNGEQGIAIEGMIGSSSIEEATFIFRTFDVCSVCTTQ
ncbi:nickel-dependent hydrogenase large subunit [Sulfurovum mangrovi]|uniref:nickel-dependent hydrogenase large subunit n=1 Tax=Sulfurovum mangrovi TaxID=2893889 RepID=UPI001E5FD449|nr:nickel-dependent hydrogenase large subunit [Sulfurovum mangrovi]UFH59616.1 nickel-dependent hydrogenase large subunit [Sulfurovum mangrovi]UFH60757.1 nickel-dependent hydrogenase large subunit [Sulfurovum mangrovi]